MTLLNGAVARPGRVVFFAAYPHVFGGPERGLEVLARGLVARGWSVGVTLPGEGVAAARFADAGLDVNVVPAGHALLVYGKSATRGARALAAAAALPAYWVRLRRRFVGADLVHVFGQRGALMAGPAARLARVPMVWHVGGRETGRAINGLAATVADAVLAVSRYAADGLPARAHPTVVQNAVDPAAFGTYEAHLDADVVCAARLTAEKGVDVLVRAAVLLRERVPDLRVVIYGAPQTGHESYRADLDALTHELDLAEVVRFAGPVDTPYALWAGARVYVQPSRQEGFGLAAAEAMASGLPVIASAVGGLVEVLDGGRVGVLVPPDDPRALAAAIERLLDDRPEAARLAEAGQARAAAYYAVDAMVDGVEAVYWRLLSPE